MWTTADLPFPPEIRTRAFAGHNPGYFTTSRYTLPTIVSLAHLDKIMTHVGEDADACFRNIHTLKVVNNTSDTSQLKGSVIDLIAILIGYFGTSLGHWRITAC